jgi:hypothetical protein
VKKSEVVNLAGSMKCLLNFTGYVAFNTNNSILVRFEVIEAALLSIQVLVVSHPKRFAFWTVFFIVYDQYVGCNTTEVNP